MVTRERVAELLEYDGEKLIWKVGRKGVSGKGSEAGYIYEESTGVQYRRVKICGSMYKAHRLIWLLHYGEWPKQFIDHIDGNGLNNRIENLRDVNHTENLRNQRKSVRNTSGATGVYWCHYPPKWQARIRVNKKQIHLGYFTNKEDAIAARKAAEAEYGFHPNHGRDVPCSKTSSIPDDSTAIPV